VNSRPSAVKISRSSHGLFASPFLCVPALVILFSIAPLYEARHLTALGDYDIWWHLRTGTWILQNHSFPHVALFTQYSERPWIAYSWGFEIIAATFYKLFGLRGVPLLQMSFKLSFGVMAFRLARSSLRNFWPAIFLAALGQYAITDFKARPGSLSILLFGIELILLFEIHRTRNIRRLFWLTPLFIFWANVHIQFVYGLFALGLFAAVMPLENLARRLRWNWFVSNAGTSSQPMSALIAMAVFGSCAFATLLTPYSYHTYQVAWQYAHSTATYNYIAEMHAMNFRWTEHYVRLLLAMAACFSLGKRRPLNLFGLALLATAALVSFRQQRDAWFMVLTSIAVIADAHFSEATAAPLQELQTATGWYNLSREKIATVLLVAAAFLIAVFRYVPSDRESLLVKVGQTFPVKACDMIRDNQLPDQSLIR
jgi:hypothetical protein